ncbi:MID1 family protein [Aspergillus affinis]|uniref:MID1 family protein n=1 Tax=Aspergillus affinis TaxID=1070780 RepID=UPI0022FEA0B7|nr:putative cora family metal ion transporter [Aspergillus affinis]KAI9037359.1 putative cora family metal ion transporter [Aspergillus affinis]
MRLNRLLPLGRSDATVSATALYCILAFGLFHLDLADVANPASSSGGNEGNVSIGGGVQFPYALESHQGLVLEDATDETGETRGLEIIRRAPAESSALSDNKSKKSTIKLGQMQWWYFPQDAGNDKTTNKTSSDQIHENLKRSRTVFISLTTCSKPSADKADSGHEQSLPQLEVYVSISNSVQKPGPDEDFSNQMVTKSEDGYMSIATLAQGDVYIGVAAPNSSDYSGSYSYEIAASTDGYYHNVDDEDQFVSFLDSDANAALFATPGSAESDLDLQNASNWTKMTPPYTMFVSNVNNTAISGLRRSYCALNQFAQIGKGGHGLQTSMANRSEVIEEQLYVTGLNRSSVYTGILAMDGNSTEDGSSGGGGKVWKPFRFSTKAEDSCAVLFNLSFCSDVAYAVPSNPSLKAAKLGSIYDDYAAAMYKNFTYSLDQIQCDASDETRFSLAVGCDDCAKAYKQWLCAVTIPRCSDFSSSETFLRTRNAGQAFLNGTSLTDQDPLRRSPVTNQSRNSLIDSDIKPGPYKEVLPCQEVCYNLVKSCPAALGFSCPDGKWLNASYSARSDNSSIISCNYPGVEARRNGHPDLHRSLWMTLRILALVWAPFWVLGN